MILYHKVSYSTWATFLPVLWLPLSQPASLLPGPGRQRAILGKPVLFITGYTKLYGQVPGPRAAHRWAGQWPPKSWDNEDNRDQWGLPDTLRKRTQRNYSDKQQWTVRPREHIQGSRPWVSQTWKQQNYEQTEAITGWKLDGEIKMADPGQQGRGGPAGSQSLPLNTGLASVPRDLLIPVSNFLLVRPAENITLGLGFPVKLRSH